MHDERIGSFIRKAAKYEFQIGYKIPLEEGGIHDFKNIKLIHPDPDQQKIANDLTIKLKNEIIEFYMKKV